MSEKELMYKSKIAPLEIARNSHQQYYLYVDGKIKVISKDLEFLYLQAHEWEMKYKRLNK